jgi:hypothetical protein
MLNLDPEPEVHENVWSFSSTSDHDTPLTSRTNGDIHLFPYKLVFSQNPFRDESWSSGDLGVDFETSDYEVYTETLFIYLVCCPDVLGVLHWRKIKRGNVHPTRPGLYLSHWPRSAPYWGMLSSESLRDHN